MPGYFFYLLLAAIGLAVTAYVMYKKKSYYKLITFFLFSALVADCGEVLVLLVLSGYSYTLGIYSDPYAESILAHIITNSTLWPGAAVFTAAYAPRFRWIISISLIFIALDVLFRQLGVYQHHWWQSWMSGLAVFIYCIVMRSWYSKFEKSSICRFISFSSMFSIITFLPPAVLLLTGMGLFRTGIFSNLYKDSIFFSFILHLAVAPVCTFFLCILKKWYWKLMLFVIFVAGDLLLMAFGVLRFLNGGNIYFLILMQIASLIVFIGIERKYKYKTAPNLPE